MTTPTTTPTVTTRRSRLRHPATWGSLSVAGAAMLVGVAAPAHAADTGIPVLEAIKSCESGGSYTAVNPTSGAAGAYQFMDATWQSLSSTSGYSSAAQAPESVQDAAAIELYNQAGTQPWVASQHCWSGMVTDDAGTVVETEPVAAVAAQDAAPAESTDGDDADTATFENAPAAEAERSGERQDRGERADHAERPERPERADHTERTDAGQGQGGERGGARSGADC
ncbi:MAG: transglycosylase family protein [Micrococcus sp.]|nr:transglycosylase family protein [Micrococcus sp.]